jgi:hypothetical protein
MMMEDHLKAAYFTRTSARFGRVVNNYLSDVKLVSVTGLACSEEEIQERHKEFDVYTFVRPTAKFEFLLDKKTEELEEKFVVGSAVFWEDKEIIEREMNHTDIKVGGACSGIDTVVKHYFEDSEAY